MTAFGSENVYPVGIVCSLICPDGAGCGIPAAPSCSFLTSSYGTSVYGVGGAFASGFPSGPYTLHLDMDDFRAQIHLLRRLALSAPCCQLPLYLMSARSVILS